MFRFAVCAAACVFLALPGAIAGDPLAPRKLKARIVQYPQKLDSGLPFVVTVEVKNTCDRPVVIPRGLCLFDMRITDRDSGDVPTVEDVSVSIAPAKASSFLVLKPGESTRIEAAAPAAITESAGGHGISLNWLLFTNELQPGVYALSYDVSVRGNAEVIEDGVVRELKAVFPNAECNIELRTTPVIIVVNGKT